MALLDHRPFRLTCTPALGAVVLGLEGELDAESATEVRERLGDLILHGVLTVVVDLQHLTFIDSTGLGVLVGAVRRLRERGGDLVLSAPPPAVLRAIEVSGLAEIFTVTRA
jgi:anti-sigma B factor antagonist